MGIHGEMDGYVAVLLGLIGLIRYLGLVLGFKKKLKLR